MFSASLAVEDRSGAAPFLQCIGPPKSWQSLILQHAPWRIQRRGRWTFSPPFLSCRTYNTGQPVQTGQPARRSVFGVSAVQLPCKKPLEHSLCERYVESCHVRQHVVVALSACQFVCSVPACFTCSDFRSWNLLSCFCEAFHCPTHAVQIDAHAAAPPPGLMLRALLMLRPADVPPPR